jgi:hypothetical protein
MKTFALAAGFLSSWFLPLVTAQTAHPGVNADSSIVADFQKRVADYLHLRKAIEAKLPALKATASPENISHHEDELGRMVREARKDASEGAIFTPVISREIRRLLAIAMEPGDGDAKRIRESLRHAEPVQLRLNVNDSYPAQVPLQSTPPTVLANLPELPSEIEYRITGRDLVLLDTKANLVIDVMTGVFS